MKIYELLRSAESFLSLIDKNDVKISDVRYLDMFADWKRLREEGHKYEFIVHYLSTQYDISPSSVERITRRLNQDLRI